MRVHIIVAFAFAVSVLGSIPAGAHPMAESMVFLDIDEPGVGADLRLPLRAFETGFGRSLGARPAESMTRLRDEIAAYVAGHLSAVDPRGVPWSTEIRDLKILTEGGVEELAVKAWLAPPAGASPRRFTLRYDVIVHQLLTHKILVWIRHDWKTGVTGEDPELVGRITYRVHELDVVRAEGSRWAGFIRFIRLGMSHIAAGTDHLLFLLVLLLPAPLLARQGHWQSFAGIRKSLSRLVRTITAFTLGHSLTLVLGAVGWFRAPSGPVEVIIALSILVSALHAIRPLFPDREAWIAGSFGLVHGLAFAAVMTDAGLHAWQAALAILGFNLGVELMQLVVVALTVPWLVLLARTQAYTPVRLAGALVAGIAALGWTVQRAFGWHNPIDAWVEGVVDHPVLLLLALATLAVGATVFGLVRRGVGTDQVFS